MSIARTRLIPHILLVLAAVPVAIWFGRVLLPPGEGRDMVRHAVLLMILLPSLGLYFGWLYLRSRNPAAGLKLILLGTLFRLTLLLAMGLWFRTERPDLERAGLLFYLITSGCFLFFELVAIIGFRIGFKAEAVQKTHSETDSEGRKPNSD